MPPKHHLPSKPLVAEPPPKPSIEDYEKLSSKLQDVVNALEASKKASPLPINASKLDNLADVAEMLAVDYLSKKEDSFKPKYPELILELDDWLLPALESLNSSFWRCRSAEALCRTSIDLVINSRLARPQNTRALRKLSAMAEKPMSADLPNGKRRITGDADYIVGYGGEGNHFESSLIVVEAKCPSTFSGGAAQCLA